LLIGCASPQYLNLIIVGLTLCDIDGLFVHAVSMTHFASKVKR
jgi:hypothetical protein